MCLFSARTCNCKASLHGMDFLGSAVLFVLVFCTSVCAGDVIGSGANETSTGEVIITGHETPLIVGLPRDITCTWSGETNATTMEWFLVGLDAIPIESTSDSNSVVLSPDPNTSGLNGAMFTCKVTTATGTESETITLQVKELENTVVISTSSGSRKAGQPYTLICTVTSDRPPQIEWLDPNGQPVGEEGIIVSRNVTNGLVSTVEIAFPSLHTSHSGIYTCISNINHPPSREQAVHLLRVEIPPPTLLITREPAHPVSLVTTNSLILTCIIQLVPEVDTPVTINSRWTGHSSLTDNQRRVIVSELEGLRPMYETSVTFSTLKSSDSGSYVCSANVSPLTNKSGGIIESSWSSESLSIRVTLNVSIQVSYNPPSDFTLPSPPYYRPATSVTLTCRVHGATGTVRYRWSSTCSSCFASSSTSQSVSDSILKSTDAGIHMCTATDTDGSTGTNTTEMKLIGAGIYVVNSYYSKNKPVPNNALIVQQSSCYSRCRKVDFYCYSNSTSTNVGYVYFPNNIQYYSGSSNYHMTVSRVSPGGIHVNNYYSSAPSYWGIYTCQIPDSRGRTLRRNIGVYSSMPSAPSVYQSYYRDLSGNTYSTELGTITCRTQNSPPTNVIWRRNGVTVTVDGDLYQMTQTVTDRRNSYYNNILLIRNAVHLAGNHTYTCFISNRAGSTSASVRTTMTAEPVLNVLSSAKSIYREPFTLTCRASFIAKIASQLLQYLTLEWVGPDGVSMSEENGVTVENQRNNLSETTRSLTFHPLNMTHRGTYKCKAKVMLPDSGGTFNSTSQYHLNVLNKTIIQLKFGSMVHCSKWFEDKGIATHIEKNIKQTLTGIINKNCSCGFQTSMIDEGEFSCQTTISSVIYRARVTGSSDTLPPPELLAAIQDWLTNDGTFLYTYHGKIRLRADPHCPLEIMSFSEPECRETPDPKIHVPPSIRSASHPPPDEL